MVRPRRDAKVLCFEERMFFIFNLHIEPHLQMCPTALPQSSVGCMLVLSEDCLFRYRTCTTFSLNNAQDDGVHGYAADDSLCRSRSKLTARVWTL